VVLQTSHVLTQVLPSPDQDSILLSSTQALSPKPKDISVITMADYLEANEQINEWIAKLQKDKRKTLPSHPSVMHNYFIPLSH
jgi:hypothetical protein